MRLLLDNNLSIRLGAVLEEKAGWNVVHVRSLGLHAASDRVVLDRAEQTAGFSSARTPNFGGLLAASHEPGPSVVLVRRVANRRAEELAGILLANLPPIADDLDHGCIVVVGDDSLRIRLLPIG